MVKMRTLIHFPAKKWSENENFGLLEFKNDQNTGILIILNQKWSYAGILVIFDLERSKYGCF